MFSNLFKNIHETKLVFGIRIKEGKQRVQRIP